MKAFIFVLICLLGLSGCGVKKTTYKEVAVPVREYIYKDREVLRVDTILQSDSVFMLIKGDTVIRERYKTLYKVRYDSIYIRDTAYIEKPVTIREATTITRTKIPLWMWVVTFVPILFILVRSGGFRRVLKFFGNLFYNI